MSPIGTGQTRLSDLPGAEAALQDLCRPFASATFCPECVIVQPDQIAYPQDQLLVHHEHMTVVLEKHHGETVDVHVLEEHLDAGGDIYTRKICLTTRNGGKPVEWGVVKLDFRYMDPQVRAEILKKELPLGAILIKHDVLRRIKPNWFLRFPPDGPLVRWFGAPPGPGQPYYGRVGTIYCNEEPAIQLLEIVLNCDNGRPGTMDGPVRVDVEFNRDSSRMA